MSTMFGKMMAAAVAAVMLATPAFAQDEGRLRRRGPPAITCGFVRAADEATHLPDANPQNVSANTRGSTGRRLRQCPVE